jgi:Galactose oxidase, central domain
VKRAIPLLITALLSGCQLNFSSAGTWTVESAPPAPISTSAVVTLADGRVALIGGFVQQTGQPTAQVLIFDAARNGWGTGAPMPEPVGFGAVVAPLHDGTVLVAGGAGAKGLIGDTWLYDPARNSWRRAGNLRVPRDQPSFAVLSDGRVLVAGGSVPLAQPVQLSNGQSITEGPVAGAEIFDPTTRAWSPAGRLSAARTFISLVALPNGAALAAGGCEGLGFAGPVQVGTGAASKAAELFDPQSLSWSSTVPMPAARCGASAVPLQDGRAFIAGGDQGSGRSAVTFDPVRHSWTFAGTVAGVVAGPPPIVLANGKVLLPNFELGPQQGRVGTAFVGGQLFDPASGDWNFATTTSVLVSSLFLNEGGSPEAVALPNGEAIVLLQTVALAFHPNESPPAAQILDSTGLTILLLALAALLALLLLLWYVRGVRQLPRSSAGVPAPQAREVVGAPDGADQ